MKDDDFIVKITEIMQAQQKAEERGEYEFICPLCGATAIWGRSTYNNHLHCGCTVCGMRMME